MYRPGGFPEYSPRDQRIFDQIIATLEKHYKLWNYVHIHTPAVESIDILSRGGDVFDKQVYGLYGLAQGSTDTKEYGLHFDLTIPFARYVLDHQHELSFPFKRYQIQPVRRGERTKKGRYKEFWQFDIDVIRPSSTDMGMYYDIETIALSYNAVQEMFLNLKFEKKVVVKVSNISLTKKRLESLGLEESAVSAVCSILDSYYKKSYDTILSELSQYINNESLQLLNTIITSKDCSILQGIDGYEDISKVLQGLREFGVSVEYDISIIRGHAYYTGTVVEFFVEGEFGLGAIAGGGRYEKCTDFIDKKHSYSGMGVSISSRIMEFFMGENLGVYAGNKHEKSYLFLHFPETYIDAMKILRMFHEDGRFADMYPQPAKLQKQFSYADKSHYSYAVLFGLDEKEKNSFVLKELATGKSLVCGFEYSYGIVPLYKDPQSEKIKIGMMQAKYGDRAFPKGHREQQDKSISETMKREAFEEVGVTIERLEDKQFFYSYFLEKSIDSSSGVLHPTVLKTVELRPGWVENPTFSIDGREARSFLWLDIEDALRLHTSPQIAKLLKELAVWLNH